MDRTYDEEIHKRINHFLREKTCVQMECSEDAIALESYFEEHAEEVWERNWMNPEMQTTLLNTYPPKLIGTILKALRQHLKENDQLNAVEEIAGPVPEVLNVIKS